MKKFIAMFVVIVMVMVLGLTETPTVAYAASDDPTATEDKNVIDRAKEGAAWWTRNTKKESWENPGTHTKVTVTERRKEGDFKIEIVYNMDNLNELGGIVKFTDSATVVMFVDHIDEDVIDELRQQ